jgi:hypothetical protein
MEMVYTLKIFIRVDGKIIIKQAAKTALKIKK